MITFILWITLIAPNGKFATVTEDYADKAACIKAAEQVAKALAEPKHGYKLHSLECLPVAREVAP